MYIASVVYSLAILAGCWFSLRLQTCCELPGVASCLIYFVLLIHIFLAMSRAVDLPACNVCMVNVGRYNLPVLLFCVVSDLLVSSQVLQPKPLGIFSSCSRSLVNERPPRNTSPLFIPSVLPLRMFYCMFCKVIFA